MDNRDRMRSSPDTQHSAQSRQGSLNGVGVRQARPGRDAEVESIPAPSSSQLPGLRLAAGPRGSSQAHPTGGGDIKRSERNQTGLPFSRPASRARSSLAPMRYPHSVPGLIRAIQLIVLARDERGPPGLVVLLHDFAHTARCDAAGDYGFRRPDFCVYTRPHSLSL